MEKKSNAHITPIRPPPGDSAHSGVINTAVPRGGNGSHSRGRGGTVRKDTSPIKQETGGVHKGHFHIPAGMVVRGGGCSPYANRRYICHREAFFPRQRDFDTPGTVYHQRGVWQGRR